MLMIIAWMYFLFAYYRSGRNGVQVPHEEGLSDASLIKTKSGAFKYWELERCLNEKACPLDGTYEE